MEGEGGREAHVGDFRRLSYRIFDGLDCSPDTGAGSYACLYIYHKFYFSSMARVPPLGIEGAIVGVLGLVTEYVIALSPVATEK